MLTLHCKGGREGGAFDLIVSLSQNLITLGLEKTLIFGPVNLERFDITNLQDSPCRYKLHQQPTSKLIQNLNQTQQ